MLVVSEFVTVFIQCNDERLPAVPCFVPVRKRITQLGREGKVAEIAMCLTGDFLSPDEKIYTLDYYKDSLVLSREWGNGSL